MGMYRRERQVVPRAEFLIAARGIAIPVARAVLHAPANPFHMMVMAFLGQAPFGFKTQHLFTELAHGAVHQVLTVRDFIEPIQEGFHHQFALVEIGRLQDLHIRKIPRCLLGGIIDAVDQHAGKQEIGKDDDALEPQPNGPFQGRGDEGKGHAGIGRFRPAEPHAFPQHAGHLGHVGIGVRVRSAPAHHQQQGFVTRNVSPIRRRRSLLFRLRDPVGSGTDQLVVDPQFAPVDYFKTGMACRIGIENAWNVVLGMAGGKQHAGKRMDPLHPGFAQAVQPLMQNRVGKFQIAILHRHAGQSGDQAVAQAGKLFNGTLVARTVSAQHNPGFRRHQRPFSHGSGFSERPHSPAGPGQ